MKKEENGITLIALIITVIVMLILAGVAINLTVGDNGIFKKANEGGEIYKNVAKDEENSLGKLDNELGGLLNDLTGKLVIQEISVIHTTTSSITVEVKAIGAESYKYYYKKVEDTNFIEIGEQPEHVYTFEGLEDDVTYTIKVEAISSSGTVEKEIEASTTDMPSAQGVIEFSNLVWEQKKAKISMTTESEHEIQYQVNNDVEGSWITGREVSELNLNDTVYARLWDGTNGGSSASITIMELTPPHINIDIGQVRTNSIAVNVEAVDNEAGMPESPIYQYYIKKSEEENYPETATHEGAEANYVLTGLIQNTEYDIKVKTRDIAQNEGEVESKNNRTVEVTSGNGAITFGAINWNNAKASISMSTTTSYTIQYQINSTSGEWQTGTTASNLNLNDTVYARLWDGVNAGDSVNTKIIDTAIPNVAGISFNTTSTTTGATITASVTQSDGQSGLNIGACRWVYNNTAGAIGTNGASYTGGAFSSTPQNIGLSAGAPGTYYLHVLTVDNAGNARESISGAVNVSQFVTGVALNKTSTVLRIGGMDTLIASVSPDNATNKGINWTTSNGNVVTVSGGVITARGAGSATITATAVDGSGRSASCSVTVLAPGAPDAGGIFTENSTINGGGESYANPTIPKGFKPVNEGNAIWGSGNGYQYGLIIQDAEGNQFVWVAVDGYTVALSRYTFATNGTPSAVGDSALTGVIESFQELTSSDQGNTVARDINGFKNSVAIHKGYYIARYEASYGVDGKPNSKISNNKSFGTSEIIGGSVETSAPTEEGNLWNYVTQPNAATACRNMYDGNYGAISDLTNSYAWDTAIVFIQKYSGAAAYSRQTRVTYNIANTGTTGDEKCHIYDMASNCAEWTTETFILGTGSKMGWTRRGTSYYDSKDFTASRNNGGNGSGVRYISFRPILYLR